MCWCYCGVPDYWQHNYHECILSSSGSPGHEKMVASVLQAIGTCSVRNFYRLSSEKYYSNKNNSFFDDLNNGICCYLLYINCYYWSFRGRQKKATTNAAIKRVERMTIRNRLKILVTKTMWALSRTMCIFPVDNNKVFFMSYDGKQYSDSPKYISDYYLINNRSLKQVWGFNKNFELTKADMPQEIVCCKKGTWAFLYHLFTSKEIVINDFMSTLFKIRKGQIVLNTWHGGGTFKTIGMSRNVIVNELDFCVLNFQCQDFANSPVMAKRKH